MRPERQSVFQSAQATARALNDGRLRPEELTGWLEHKGRCELLNELFRLCFGVEVEELFAEDPTGVDGVVWRPLGKRGLCSVHHGVVVLPEQTRCPSCVAEGRAVRCVWTSSEGRRCRRAIHPGQSRCWTHDQGRESSLQWSFAINPGQTINVAELVVSNNAGRTLRILGHSIEGEGTGFVVAPGETVTVSDVVFSNVTGQPLRLQIQEEPEPVVVGHNAEATAVDSVTLAPTVEQESDRDRRWT